MQIPSYHVVEDVVNNNGDTGSAAEAHGMLAGMLCANKDTDAEDWLALVFGEDRERLELDEDEVMQGLFADTVKLMQAVDFSFQLFLPDDDVALTDRASALSAWCGGFLYGIGYANSKNIWPGDCAEILQDIADISRLDEIASGEEDEVAYTEISEFVRISVQLIRGDLQPPVVKSYLH